MSPTTSYENFHIPNPEVRDELGADRWSYHFWVQGNNVLIQDSLAGCLLDASPEDVVEFYTSHTNCALEIDCDGSGGDHSIELYGYREATIAERKLRVTLAKLEAERKALQEKNWAETALKKALELVQKSGYVVTKEMPEDHDDNFF